MPTDTERREVARRLRECKRTKDNPTATFDWAIYAALDPEWYKRENWIPYNAAIDRLADLMEPSETKVTGIDRDALLALADEMDRDGKIQRTRQKDGEHWFVDGLDVREYARRIREALGVEK